MLKFPLWRIRTLCAAVALATAACGDSTTQIKEVEPESAAVTRGNLVFTPSGAVFAAAEWRAIDDKTPYLESAEARIERTKPGVREFASGVLASVSGNPAPTVLCHTSAYTCGQIPRLFPGAVITYWGAAQWDAATVASFAQFDLIYIHDAAGYYAEIGRNKAKYAQAVTGRAVITGAHFEHCGASSPTSYSRECIPLRASVQWIHAGSGTGILASTQYMNTAWLPTTAPYNGITYAGVGGGYDIVHITDPGHAVMQGSTDATFSNYGNSSHSYFSNIGGFTNVADVCRSGGYGSMWPVCSNNMAPMFLVTSVAIADQDGDGIPDNEDNCPTVGNASQADANGNAVGDACESAPAVTLAASATSVPVGTAVTFSATATDADHAQSQLTYEWRVNGLVQAGQTSSTFSMVITADATVRATVRDPGLLSGFAETKVTVVTDVTAPSIVASVAGTVGSNGWYTSDVSVTWSVTDDESAVSASTGCAASSVTSDTDGVTFTCSATSAGGTANESVTIKRDATQPVIGSSVAGTVGLNGWYTSDVEVSWTVSDATSGTSSACTANSLTSDGSQSFTCSATDDAGNSASESVAVKRDATDPLIAFSGNTGAYTVDQTIAISCATSDAMSGVATADCPTASGAAYTFALGSHTLAGSVTDRAGNSSVASTVFTVSVTEASLCALATLWSGDLAGSLCTKLENAAAAGRRGNTVARDNMVGAFINEVDAQTGKKIPTAHADVLRRLAQAL